MLSDSYESFLTSRLFLGGPAYGKNSNKIKPWYNYLYVAQFEGRYDKVKIGISSNISRRNDELNRENEGANIRYAWSMPTNLEIETKVKTLLSNFTKKNSSKRLRTETFYIPITPFILFVRVVILYVYLEEGYIQNNQTVKKKLEDYLGRARLEYIKFNDIYYRQRDNTPRMKAIVRAQKLIDAVLDIQRNIKKNGTRYSFAYVRSDYDDIIEAIRNLTKSKGTYPSGNTNVAEFINTWVQQYVNEDGEMNDALMAFLPKEGQDRSEFKEGDMVTVTYPPYKEAETKSSKEGGMAKQGDPNYPQGGSWQARLIKRNKKNKKWTVKWSFDDFKDTKTEVPEAWIHHDGDVKRGIDLTELYADLKLSHIINYGEYDNLERDSDDDIQDPLKILSDAIIQATNDTSKVKLKM